MSDTTVRFLAVGKVSAKLVVATYINQDVAGLDLQSLAGKLMKSSKVTRLGAGGDCHLSAGDSTEVHVHVDAEDHAFIAVTPTDYPRRLITAADFRREFVSKMEGRFQEAKREDELFKPSLRILRTLANKYSDVESLDKIRQLQARVEDVKMVMQDNLTKAVDRGQKIEDVDHKAEGLQMSAQLFEKRATKVRRNVQWRYYKMVALAVFIVLVIALVIFLLIEVS